VSPPATQHGNVTDKNRSLHIAAMLNPRQTASWSLADWDLLIRQMRSTGLIGRFAAEFGNDLSGVDCPPPARKHLQSALAVVGKQKHDVNWEVRCINDVLTSVGLRTILLKGAAYLMAGLPAARGRVFSDVDILVPHDRMDEVERAFGQHGWILQDINPYDQAYYRRWMHQIPPLVHVKRHTAVDVHHTIVPPTAGLRIDPGLLMDETVPLAAHDNLYVLAPPDMVLHSAVHLFNEGEFDHGLRDLSDLDLLLRHFGADPAFWPQLTDRARMLDLQRPLFYAVRHATSILETPVPDSVIRDLAHTRPGPLKLPLMDALLSRGLRPHHVSCDDRYSDLARWLLYVRAHYLRMPLHLLVPHLVRKAWKRQFPTEPRQSTDRA
jgi:hypothetical protein